MSGFKSAFFNHKNEMFGKIQNWSVLTCIFVRGYKGNSCSLNRTGREETLTYFNENCPLTFFSSHQSGWKHPTAECSASSPTLKLSGMFSIFLWGTVFFIISNHCTPCALNGSQKCRLGRYSRLCPPQQRFLVLPGDPEVLPGSFRGPADSSRLANLKKIQGRLRIMEHGGILF